MSVGRGGEAGALFGALTSGQHCSSRTAAGSGAHPGPRARIPEWGQGRGGALAWGLDPPHSSLGGPSQATASRPFGTYRGSPLARRVQALHQELDRYSTAMPPPHSPPRRPEGPAHPHTPWSIGGAPCLLAQPSVPFAARPPHTVRALPTPQPHRTLGLPVLLRQGPARGCPLPLWEASLLSGPGHTAHARKSPNKHESLSPSWVRQGAWCDDSLSSPWHWEPPSAEPGSPWRSQGLAWGPALSRCSGDTS